MNDNLNQKMEKKVKVELKVGEFYLLSVIACKGICLSKQILQAESLDKEVSKALNTVVEREIPRIAFKVMDQIGIFELINIISKSNTEGTDYEKE